MLAEDLAHTLVLGALLEELKRRFGGYELVAHWPKGEFHHDVIVRACERVIAVSTNCNAGVKEVLVTAEAPTHGGLWRMRCADTELEGEPPRVLERATTVHFFDPCELLAASARSELKPEARERQRGGGWICKK